MIAGALLRGVSGHSCMLVTIKRQ